LPTDTHDFGKPEGTLVDVVEHPPSFKKTNFIIMFQTVILFGLIIALIAISGGNKKSSETVTKSPDN
jgi:hypothetical protein